MAILRQLDQLENGLSLFWGKSPEEIGPSTQSFIALSSPIKGPLSAGPLPVCGVATMASSYKESRIARAVIFLLLNHSVLHVRHRQIFE